MRWLELPWTGRPRSRATAVDVAAALAEVIVQNTNRLRRRLEEEGMARPAGDRFQGGECLLECTLFEWFLCEAVVLVEFRRHADAVSRALSGRILVDLFRSAVGMENLADFDDRRETCFAEYAEAAAASESLQRLGAVACARIFGREGASERGTMIFARLARARLSALRGLGAAYVIVENRPARSDMGSASVPGS